MGWQVVDTECGQVEVKKTNKLIMLREVGQTSEYPHSTVSLDWWGNPDLSTLHHSDSGNKGRFGMREVVQAAVTIAVNL